MKRITLPAEKKRFIQQSLGVTRETVSKSLGFTCNTELGKEIRKLAYNLGGQLIGDDLMVTYHNADDSMVQKFGRRIEIVLWKQDGKVQVYTDGILTEQHNDLSIEEFMTLQERVDKINRELL